MVSSLPYRIYRRKKHPNNSIHDYDKFSKLLKKYCVCTELFLFQFRVNGYAKHQYSISIYTFFTEGEGKVLYSLRKQLGSR